MNRDNEVTLRLSVKGRRELLDTMRAMGGEYQIAVRKIEQGSRKAGPALQGVNKAAEEANAGLRGLAGQGGIVGSVLESMGPSGLAAAAGLGAVAISLGAALKISREAVTAFDEIGKGAASLKLSTDAFQALKAAAADEGVEFGQVEGAVRALDKAHADLVLNQGELYARLKDTNPELVRMLRNTTDNDERLRLIAASLKNAASATERAHIAYAAFGESGADVARILETQADGMDGMIDRARELGIVVREDVIRNAEDMHGKLDLAARVVDLQLKQAFVDLAPVLVDSANLMADLSRSLAEVISRFKEVDDRSTDQLKRRSVQIASTFAALRGTNVDAVNRAQRTGAPLNEADVGSSQFVRRYQRGAIEEFNKINKEIAIRSAREAADAVSQIRRRATDEDLQAERAALVDHLRQIEEVTREANADPDTKVTILDLTGWKKDADEARAAIAAIDAELSRRKGATLAGVADPAADAEARRKAAEYARLQREAIQLQKELGDYTAYLAEQTARYQQMLDAHLITQAQYDAAVKGLKDDLSGTADALKRWADLIAQSLTPAQQISRQIIDLQSDFAAGRVEIDLYNAALDELKTKLAAAKEDERKAAPGYADAEQIRAQLKQAALDALSPAEQLARETERVNKLVADHQLDPDKATDWLDLYAKRLQEAARSTGLLGQAEKVLDGIQSGRIRTVDDLGRAVTGMLIDMVRQYLAARRQMQGGSFLDFVLGTGNFGFGGSGQSGGILSAFASALGWTGGAAPAHATVHTAGVSHSGGSGAWPPNRRRLANGIYPGEQLQIIRNDETVLTAAGRMNIAGQVAAMASERAQMAGLVGRALSGAVSPAGQGLKVSINNYAGAEVSTERRDGPDGPELSIDVKGHMRDMVRGGVFDDVFQRRYGLRPVGA